jgi:NAD+ kinase
VSPPDLGNRVATVMSHRNSSETRAALERLAQEARARGWTLRLNSEETAKYGLEPGPGLELDAAATDDIALCIVLGGDGTILRALSRYARTGVPVFAINFGEIGFLATVEPWQLDEGARRAFTGDYELMILPGVELEAATGTVLAINDVSLHRKVGERVADIAFSLEGDTLGRVRCDGLVVSTPAGSTGYNLANGGPVMAWGVEGYVVSFIAPHSLTARPLVVAPEDEMMLQNLAEEPLDVSVDGRPLCELCPGASNRVRFVDRVATLARLPGSNFYRRLQQKFGLLSS